MATIIMLITIYLCARGLYKIIRFMFRLFKRHATRSSWYQGVTSYGIYQPAFRHSYDDSANQPLKNGIVTASTYINDFYANSAQKAMADNEAIIPVQGVDEADRPALRLSHQHAIRPTNKISDTTFDWTKIPTLRFRVHKTANVTQRLAISLATVATRSFHETAPQVKYLPFVIDQLKIISMDEITFKWQGVCAKPDAVFATERLDRYYVVEYKSRFFSNQTDTINPQHVLQLLVTCMVFQQHLPHTEVVNAQGETRRIKPRITPVLRFNNAAIEISGWETLIGVIQKMAKATLGSIDAGTISATDLAKAIRLIDPIFEQRPGNEQEAKLRGNILHYLMSIKPPRDVCTLE